MKVKKVVLLLLVLVALQLAIFAVPNTVTYQGRILENGVALNGDASVRLRLWDSLTDGTQLYDSGLVGVSVNNGVYVQEVPATALNNASVFLETSVGADDFSPRVKINSDVYALLASGLSGQGNSTEAVNLSDTGNVGVGVDASTIKLSVNGGVKVGYDTVEEAGVLRWNSGNTKLEYYNGSEWTALN